MTEPRNLAHGWVGFDFAKAFGRPVKVINDAAMQALGGYDGGTMLFLGLGTGLGSALMVRGHIVPMELGRAFLEERLHRGLRWPPRARETRQEKMAEDRQRTRDAIGVRDCCSTTPSSVAEMPRS